MSQQLISRNSDLKKLRDEGYQIEIYGGHLVVHHIPFVNANKEVKYGKLVCDLTLSGDKTEKPRNHVMNFCGEDPCNKDGTIITGIQHGKLNSDIGNGIVLTHSFSNKPKQGYPDYYQKVNRYAEIITAPAISIDSSVTHKPNLPVDTPEDDAIFKILDTNSSRSNIDHINLKLKGLKIAIVGLGGTGSYILDLVAKTWVDEIHLFDGDEYLNHNAFRSPSCCSIEELDTRPKKVHYYSSVYGQLRNYIFPHDVYLHEENYSLMKGMDYVFIAIDSNDARREIIEYLLKIGVAFIDVGLGVNEVDSTLIGTLRVTTGDKNKSDHLERRVPSGESADNEYSTNIQIAELNALNATLAVMKWKRMCGFYQDLSNEFHTTFAINVNQLLNEEIET